uniref:hypothetical protein n=1 Tax=Nocardia brasiliensis TaxID=37326 RepID=UPI003D78341B
DEIRGQYGSAGGPGDAQRECEIDAVRPPEHRVDLAEFDPLPARLANKGPFDGGGALIWGGRAGHPLADQFTTTACLTAARSAEGALGVLSG